MLTKITILGGFLGSGKTTLLNRLLHDTPEPLGIIVNDFGSVNVDAQLLSSQKAVEGEVALQNGCICCTIRADLLSALLSLTLRPDPPKHVVIETSGVSDPAAVARTFLHPKLEDLVELSAIVVCVDPTEFGGLEEAERALATEQVRHADFVVLTKHDLATPDELAATGQTLRDLVSQVRIVESSPEHPPTDLILDLPVMWSRPRLERIHAHSPHVHPVGGGGEHQHHHHHHHERHAYETWWFHSERPMTALGLRRALETLPRSIFRAKGIAHVAERPDEQVVVQVAGRRVTLSFAEPWRSEPKATDLVVLGSEGSLDPQALQAHFEASLDDGSRSTESFLADLVGCFQRALGAS